MKKRVVIYARFSSHSQTEQSIEGQLRECYEYAKRQGLLVVAEYIDRALTGTTDKRPEFLRMIDDSKKKTFDYVLVYQLDRFARNRYDSANYKAKLKKNGVRVLSAKENITEDASGILIEGVLESMAEYYSAELSQKVKRGIRESYEKGYFIGGYGLILYDDKILIFYNTDDNHPMVIKRKDTEKLISHLNDMASNGKTAINDCPNATRNNSPIVQKENSLEPQGFKRVSLGGESEIRTRATVYHHTNPLAGGPLIASWVFLRAC